MVLEGVYLWWSGLFSFVFPVFPCPLCYISLCVEFWTLAADAQWNDSDLKAVFPKGLNKQLKDELATQDEPADLHFLVSLPGKIYNHVCKSAFHQVIR